MKLFEVDAQLDDLRDKVSGLILAAKGAGMDEISPNQLLFDLRRSGNNMGIDELMLLLKGLPGVEEANPRSIKIATTSPEEKLKQKDDEIVSKMASKSLDKKIGQ